MNFSTPIREIKGVGEKTEGLLQKMGVYTVGDILLHFPREYVRFQKPIEEIEIHLGEKVAVCLQILAVPIVKKTRTMQVTFADGLQGSKRVELVWFRMPYLKNKLRPGCHYVFYGKILSKNGNFRMEQPQIFTEAEYEQRMSSPKPVYSHGAGISNHQLEKMMGEILSDESLEIADFLPKEVVEQEHFMSYEDALKEIHCPKTMETLIPAHKRLAFDDFFFFLLTMNLLKEKGEKKKNAFSFAKDGFLEELTKKLPYTLTQAQQETLKETCADLCGPYVMQRLVQGDVGSGKTVIAFLLMALCAHNGYQSAIMAPTDVLARQHFETFSEYCKAFELDFPVILLTGSMTAKEKRLANEKISEKPDAMIIGTHALIQEGVNYKRLALVVTDEQHRFGVRQRESLRLKGEAVHVLVMSATPIPRTLGIILYGDLDICVMNQMPAERLPIKNCVIGKKGRPAAYQFIKKQVEEGHQAYVICPLVEESEEIEAENVLEYEKKLRDVFRGTVKTACLHGKMKPEEKNKVMEAFASGKVQVLVSTTVVEVGVNVPNATVMMIENAERFGLAALHQLRGRVGRGKAQSYCIFVNCNESNPKNKRLDILVKSNDGFYIASEDLKLRGPGDFCGIRQSGMFRFQVADIFQDADMLSLASNVTKQLMEDDPELSKEGHQGLKLYIEKTAAKQMEQLNL